MSEPRWWVWQNGYSDGRWQLLAYNKEYPVYPDGGDPLTLGEPVFSGTAKEVRKFAPDAAIDWKCVRGRDD